MRDPERSILIVEDDPSTRAFLAELLQSHGYPVMTATDGEHALTVAREKSPCLILLDLQMPGMDGFAFRAAQLRRPDLANTPVIIISGRLSFRAAEPGGVARTSSSRTSCSGRTGRSCAGADIELWFTVVCPG